MMPGRAVLLALAALICGVALLGPAAAETAVPLPVPRPERTPSVSAALPTAKPAPASEAAAAGPVVAYDHGRVVIFRGYLNVFSRGMDKIANDLKAQGIPVVLDNHSHWQPVADEIIKEFRTNPDKVKPVIIIGHSLGGNASMVAANWLVHNGVPVRLVVVFDAVGQTHLAEKGVQEVINFYKPKGSAGQQMRPGPGFTGVIDNVDLTQRQEIDHLNIDKNPVLQAEVMEKILAIFKGAPPPKAPATAAATNG